MTAVPLELAVAVCAEFHISHSAFLTWPADDQNRAIWQYLRQRQVGTDGVTRPYRWDPQTGWQF